MIHDAAIIPTTSSGEFARWWNDPVAFVRQSAADLQTGDYFFMGEHEFRHYPSPEQVRAGLQGTRDFIADVRDSVEAGVKAGKDLNAVYKDTMARLTPKYGHWVIFQHCMPFDVTRCFDEVTQYPDPRIWTAERDVQMWQTLEGTA